MFSMPETSVLVHMLDKNREISPLLSFQTVLKLVKLEVVVMDVQSQVYDNVDWCVILPAHQVCPGKKDNADSIFVWRPFSRTTQVTRYLNVSILDFIGAKDGGGGSDNWSYKMCKAQVRSSQPTNQHPTFYRPDALPVAQPTACKSTERERVVTVSVDRFDCFWHQQSQVDLVK